MQRDSQWYVRARPLSHTRFLVGKRAFDITVSLFLIVISVPILLILSASIVVSSGRPILFKQTRTGQNGRPFVIYKFRTMVCEKRKEGRHAYSWKGGVPDNFTFKNGFDVNVTPIGRFLRKYSLDELPQLFNVLAGTMSIIGPRPEIPEITIHYNIQQRKRLLAKPGITGYAQVNGRSEITHGKKIEYDLHYIANQSLLLDAKVLFATIMLVIKGKGAF